MSTIQQFSLSDQVYEIIKQRIIERDMSPNDKFDLKELSTEMGTSRMPIVDALTRLESEGLVTKRNRVGTYVTPISEAMFAGLFEARQMVETWISEEVTLSATPDDIDQLKALLDTARELLHNTSEADFDYLKFSQLDCDFHFRLVQLCQNTRIVEFYRSLNTHLHIARVYLFRALNRSQEGQREHEDILDALVARDVVAFREAQRHHLEISRVSVMQLLQEHKEL